MDTCTPPRSSFGARCHPDLRQRWFTLIAVLRTDILKWSTKQSKQVQSGYPLLTMLTCLEPDKQMVSNVDVVVDLMQRQIKARGVVGRGGKGLGPG